MVSDRTRNEVWQQLLDAARLVRYYDSLADRNHRKDSALRYLLLASAASGVAAVLELLPGIAQLIAGALIGLLVIWDIVVDYGRKAAVLHVIGLECQEIEGDLEKLWLEVDDADADEEDLRSKTNALGRKLTHVTSWARHVNVREHSKLNEECAAAAYQVAADRYAA